MAIGLNFPGLADLFARAQQIALIRYGIDIGRGGGLHFDIPQPAPKPPPPTPSKPPATIRPPRNVAPVPGVNPPWTRPLPPDAIPSRPPGTVSEDGNYWASWEDCADYADRIGLDWFEYCGPPDEAGRTRYREPTAGPVSPIGLPRFWWPAIELPIPRGKRGSSPREVWEDCVRVVGPEKAPYVCGPSGRRPDDWVIAAGAGNVFLPTLPEVVPVVAPAVREILRRVIPILVPMLPDWFPQPAPEPIPRGPTKRPRVKPPVETPELFPIEIDPAWRVIHPYPVPVFRPDPTSVPRRGPLSRPRVRPRSVPLPHGWPSPTPVPAPTTRPSPAPTPTPGPRLLPKVLPYLLPFAYPLLFPTGPVVSPDFGIPRTTPKPPRAPPGAPKPLPPPTSPLTPFQPGPLELGQPMPFRLGSDPCQCTDTKPKRKPRKPRTECREGTYRETARGTLKRPRRAIPCR